jgi:hypothetical protein
MNLRSVVNHLEVCIAHEIESSRTALSWIARLERALAAYDPSEFEAVVEDGATLGRTEEGNARRRERLLGQLGEAWGVPAKTLTLGGVARRLGAEGRRLEELRGELREVVGQVMKGRRRLSALIGMHRRINSDLMQLIMGCESEQELERGGSLINAEA